MIPTLLQPNTIIFPPDIQKTPIDYIKSLVVGGKRFIIVKAKTGSGKSTVFPFELFNFLKQTVVSVQPRIATTISLSQSMATRYSSLHMEQNIGFHTGVKKRVPKSGPYLLYCTGGVFVNMLDTLDKVGAVIIDEVHERSTELDYIMLVIRIMLRKQKCPLFFLTSATLDEDLLLHYFKNFDPGFVSVAGHSFTIETRWPAKPFKDIISGVVDIVKIIDQVKESDPKDVIVFIPGQKESEDIKKKLIEENLNIEVLIINRPTVIAEGKDFQMLNQLTEKRKVILSSVVVETGITIPTARYVIDSGWVKIKEKYGSCEGLIQVPVTKDRVFQRRGRIGRVSDGIFYPLYTKETFLTLNDIQMPNIQSQGLDPILLRLIRQNPTYTFFNHGLISLPPWNSVRESVKCSVWLGYLSPTGLTKLGLYASQFLRIGLVEIKLILMAYVLPVYMNDLVTICAILNAQVKVKDMNIINVLSLYNEFKELIQLSISNILNVETLESWATGNKTDVASMIRILIEREAIKEELEQVGINSMIGWEYAHTEHRPCVEILTVLIHVWGYNFIHNRGGCLEYDDRLIGWGNVPKDTSHKYTNQIRIVPKENKYGLGIGWYISAMSVPIQLGESSKEIKIKNLSLIYHNIKADVCWIVSSEKKLDKYYGKLNIGQAILAPTISQALNLFNKHFNSTHKLLVFHYDLKDIKTALKSNCHIVIFIPKMNLMSLKTKILNVWKTL